MKRSFLLDSFRLGFGLDLFSLQFFWRHFAMPAAFGRFDSPRIEQGFFVFEVRRRFKLRDLGLRQLGAEFGGKTARSMLLRQSHVRMQGEKTQNRGRKEQGSLQFGLCFHLHFLCRGHGVYEVTLTPDDGAVVERRGNSQNQKPFHSFLTRAWKRCEDVGNSGRSA